jgi:hypothetical protein
VPQFAVLIRAMKKLNSKCGHCSFPVVLSGEHMGMVRVGDNSVQHQSAEPGHADLINPNGEWRQLCRTWGRPCPSQPTVRRAGLRQTLIDRYSYQGRNLRL